MSKLKVPSLQHLARNWRRNPVQIQRLLVALAENAPIFNYNPLFGAVRDMLIFRHPYEEIVEGIRRGVKREAVRSNFLTVLPLIRDHFENVHPDFVQSVERRFYPVARNLMVPFEPPLVYGLGGRIYFPWFSFWRQNPLAEERLSLFVTLVEEVLQQDPDLEMARFEILDFSAPNSKAARELKVIPSTEISRLSEARKLEMLEIFAEGYFKAMDQLAGMRPEKEQSDRDEKELGSANQQDLFP